MRKTNIRLYNSSVGQKLFVGLTGLFLCTFLLVHLSGNTLLFRNDGGAAFNQYSHFMATNIAIRLLELGLALGFLGHLFFAVRVWWRNRSSRPEGYRRNEPSENSTLVSRTMIVTGNIVFIFLAIHLKTFFVPSRVMGDPRPMYDLVAEAFRSPLYDAFYLVALALLGFHLRHGFQSAFQTFGLRPGLRPIIDAVAILFWLIVPIGYATMPLYFLFKS